MDQKVIVGIAVVVIIAVGGYFLMQKPETPTIEYALSVDSSPVSGVTVTVDGVAHESPFTTELEAGGYTVEVPDELTVEGTDYTFTGWADGGTNPEKTVTLSTDTDLEALYEEVVTDEPDTEPDPEPEPASQVTVSGGITDSESGVPIGGAAVSIDGETVTTGADGRYEVTIDKGTYTVTVSRDGYEDATGDIVETSTDDIVLDLTLIESGVTLTVLTRHGSDITRTAELLFMETEYWEEYNFVDIKWIPVTASLWIDTIDRKGDVDMAWGGGPVWFDILYREGLTSPLVSDEVNIYLDQIPDLISGAPTKRIDDDEVHWVGAAISSFGFTINTETLEEAGLPQPTKWIDLANETYSVVLPAPIIGTADPTRSTSNTRMFEIILQTYGWEEGWKLITLLGANSIIFEGSELVRDAAMRGEIGAGTTIDFYGYTAQLNHPERCQYIFPEDGTIVNADPIALINTSPNPEAAQAFIAWVLSPEGQEPWLDPTVNRLPINTQVFETEKGQERPDLEEYYYQSIDALKIEFSDFIASSYEFAMMNFFKYTLITPQQQLQDAWYELGTAKLDGDLTSAEFKTLVDELTNPLLFEFTDPDTGETETFTEEYAISINRKLMDDMEFKQAIVDLWAETAIARYSSVQDQVLSITP